MGALHGAADTQRTPQLGTAAPEGSRPFRREVGAALWELGFPRWDGVGQALGGPLFALWARLPESSPLPAWTPRAIPHLLWVTSRRGHQVWWPIGFLSAHPSQVFFADMACVRSPSWAPCIIHALSKKRPAHQLLAGMNNLLALPPESQAALLGCCSGGGAPARAFACVPAGVAALPGWGPLVVSPSAGYITEQHRLGLQG